MALTPEVILAVISVVFIVGICILLLNEISDERMRIKFSRPSLNTVKKEYHKAIKKI